MISMGRGILSKFLPVSVLETAPVKQI